MRRFVARALIGLVGAVTFGACTNPSDNPFGEGGTSPGGAAGQRGGSAGKSGAHSGAGGFLEPAAGAPDDGPHQAGTTGAGGAAVGGADNGGQGATAGQPIAGTSGIAGVGGSALGGSGGAGDTGGAGGAVSGSGGTSGSAGTGGIAGSGGSAGIGGSTGCVSGPPCAPSNRCHIGILCGLTCVDTELNVQAGAECGVGQICDATGQCVAPSCLAVPANIPNCVPEHPCHIGNCSASTSPPNHCTDLTVLLGLSPAGDGTACGPGLVNVCSGGECVVKNCTAAGQSCALGCADASGKVLKDGTPCETGKVCFVGRCIAHLSIAPTNQVFAYVPGASFSQPLAIVTDSRLNETSSDLSATISWSDNTTSPGTVSGSSGTFTVSGTHTFTTAGTKQVTVTVVSGPPPSEVVLLTFTVDTVTRSFDLPSSPYAIASGPDGNLWVSSADSVLRVTPAGDFTSFPVPHSSSVSSIAFGSDGNLWLAPTGEVARVTLAGSVSEFLLPINDHYAYRIASGPDGNLWFTQNDSTNGTYQAIGRMTPAGVLTEFDPFTPGSRPYGITAGADGNLWLTEINAGKVARMTTDGTVTEFALPSAASRPFEIIAGPDGNLWVTERGTNSVARITTSGAVTEFPGLPATLFGITAGPDGRVWFAEGGSGEIGAISSTGVVEQFQLPGSARFPMWITTGADGNLWITDPANQLMRFKP